MNVRLTLPLALVALALIALWGLGQSFDRPAPVSVAMPGPEVTDAADTAAPDEAPASAPLPPINAADLVPHNARYEIKMVSKRSGSQLLNIGGAMSFAWQPACDAWIADHRFDLLYEYTNGMPVQIVSDFSTYESFDGKDFSYNAQRTRNDAPYEVFRGHAVKGEQAVYTVPAGLSFDLSPATFFPMGHTLTLLNHARAGERFFDATVFDGSDSEGPTEINAFIGKHHPDAAHITLAESADMIDRTLLDSPAWDIRLAFFLAGGTNGPADYEMNITLHENGVISDMLVEYDDFSVTQKLVALKKGEKPACDE